MRLMRMKATTQSGSVGAGGREWPIVDGFFEVEEQHVKALQEQGFVLVGEVKRPANAKNGETEVYVSVPRKQMVAVLRQLGVFVAENMPEEEMVKTLANRAAQLYEWLADAGEDRKQPGPEPLDAQGPVVGDQPQRGKSTFSQPKPPQRQQRAKR